MTALTIEDLATTSDDAAVRRRFDARNLVWLSILLGPFLVVSLIEVGTNMGRGRTWFDVATAASNFVLVLVTLIVMRDVFRAERKGRAWMGGARIWVRKHVSATVITFMLAQYGLAISFTRREHDWAAWAVFTPLLMMGFRMLVSESVLVHSVLFTVALAMGLMGEVPKGDRGPSMVAIGIVNVIALGVELLTARRLRRQIVADWSERRAQAQEQLRMRDELQYARAIQLSMLPEAPPALDWVDLAGASLPATEVGGDYFDYFVIGDRLAIVSGDVAGHGLASGLVLAALRSGFTLLRDSLHDPAAVLRRLHDLIGETTRRRTLVTCAVLLLDREARRATFASAGHPPAIVRRDGSVGAVELFAPPLGVRLPVTIPQREMPFAPGDLFVLHTDGVYEAESPAGETYGIERIEAVVRECGDASAAAVRDAIVRDVERFRGGGAQRDDITVVVARVR